MFTKKTQRGSDSGEKKINFTAKREGRKDFPVMTSGKKHLLSAAVQAGRSVASRVELHLLT